MTLPFRHIVLMTTTLAAVAGCSDAVEPTTVEHAAHSAPGIQYLVLDSSHVLFEFNGGWADIANRRRMDSATTMMAYSMSKTITAAAVLQLVEAGQLDLDAPVSRYLPSQPYGSAITIRQVIAHTAGIPNPIPLKWVHLASSHASFDADAALASVLQAHGKTTSEPGRKYAYANIGYWLLERVVERVTGEPFTAYVTRRVLQPIAATQAELGYAIPDPARHARGYLEKYSIPNLLKGFLIDDAFIGDYEDGWLRIESHFLNSPGMGGLVGTSRGFGKFLQDQLRGHSVILGDAGRRLFFEQQRTASGTPIDMTLGWHIGSLDGARYFYKEGGGGGFHSMMRLYPDAGIASVMIVNATTMNVGKAQDEADREVLGLRG